MWRKKIENFTESTKVKWSIDPLHSEISFIVKHL
jgi:hypothetical protein